METKLPRLLNADEIDVRVGQVKPDYITYLLYKDARCDMKRLDEMFGQMNWQRDHKEVKGVMYCGISVWDEEKKMFVTKWDAGTESNTEAEKGEASDSFKRACVNWGIGRELYTGPRIFVKTALLPRGKDTRLDVKEIGYNENREINHLVLVIERTDNVVFSFGKGVQQPTKVQQPATLSDEQICTKMLAHLKAEPELFARIQRTDYQHVPSVDFFTDSELLSIYKAIKAGKYKA